MTCGEYRKMLQRQLADEELRGSFGELTNRLPQDCQGHLRQCRACARYTAALQMTTKPGELGLNAPQGLAGRAALAARRPLPKREEAFREETGLKKIPYWLRLSAAAVVLVMVTAGATLAIVGLNKSETVIVSLRLEAPQAQQVSVVGDWNEWQPQAQPLTDADNDGVWEATIRVPKGGEYQYQFLIDGKQWIPDPNAPLQVQDGFGGTNSVLDI